MKKYFSKMVTAALIPTLSLATILCCDLSVIKVAKAAESTMPACHRPKAKAAVPVKSKCDCCAHKQLQADVPTKASFQIPQTPVLGYAFLDILSASSVVFKSKFNLAYLNGPPGPISESPRYIHFHNFRI